MTEAVVVTCSASKLSGIHKAKDLYIGNLFKIGRKRAEESGLPWFILSAEHGLIDPETEIASYDSKISKNDKSRLLSQIKETGRSFKTIHCIGASSYAPCLYAVSENVIAACAYFVGNPGTTRLYVEYRDNSLSQVEKRYFEYLTARKRLILPKTGAPAVGVNCRASGKITGTLWDIFDNTLNDSSLLPKFLAYSKGIEDATIRVQYMKYHRFFNLPLCGLK